MRNNETKPTFYVFIDVEKSLNDINFFNELKRKGIKFFVDETIDTSKIEILNDFLEDLSKYYLIDLIITSKDSLYAESLLHAGDFKTENVRVTDYLFCDDDNKSRDITHYLTMSKKDKDVRKVHNFIIFDGDKVAYAEHLKNHLVSVNIKKNPLSKQNIAKVMDSIFEEASEKEEVQNNVM